MIRQKRRLQLEFRNTNGEVGSVTVGDLRAFIKSINDHNLPQDQPINFWQDPYRFGFRGFEAEWEEWSKE